MDLTIPLICLALNIYHESRMEPLVGQLAVGIVTLNRAHYRKDKICEVVFKDRQFSWTLLPEWAPRNQQAWTRSLHVAKSSFKVQDFTGGATHFHATYVHPRWARNMEYLGQWGNHVFYKKRRVK